MAVASPVSVGTVRVTRSALSIRSPASWSTTSSGPHNTAGSCGPPDPCNRFELSWPITEEDPSGS